jgi:hypothetical protein
LLNRKCETLNSIYREKTGRLRDFSAYFLTISHYFAPFLVDFRNLYYNSNSKAGKKKPQRTSVPCGSPAEFKDLRDYSISRRRIASAMAWARFFAPSFLVAVFT